MNSLDRFIRVVYKELPLYKFTNIQYESNKNKVNELVDGSFNFKGNYSDSNSYFREMVKNQYKEIYPKGYSPDEILSTMETIEYLMEKKGYRSTIGLIFHVADELLYYANSEILVNFDDLLEWNGFINKVDSSVFYAAFLAMNSIENHDHKVQISHDNRRLKKILAKGIAENHMHLKGSGYTSSMNWYYFYSTDQLLGKKIENLIDIKFRYREDDIALAFNKLRVIRLYLFQSILINEYRGEKSTEDLRYLKVFHIYNLLYISNINELELFLRALDTEIDTLMTILESRHINYRDSPKKYMEIEREFLRKLFKLYLYNSLDDLEVYLFNVYILGLSQFKFLFYQDNEAMGFEKFKDSEDIKEEFLPDNINTEIYRTVFDKYYSEKHVKKIEFRVSPRSKDSLIDMVDELDRINDEIFRIHFNKDSGIKKLEYGIIIHYIKFKEEFNLENYISRKEKFYNDLELQSRFLSRFFESIENDHMYKYQKKIVGVDTANYEYNCRPELFGAVYRKHREEIKKTFNLNFTYHVGEEFNTLSNGLRAIDETLEFLQFKRGDRLGHALALGIDSDDYFESKRYKMISSLEEYLDDLAWMYFVLEENNCLNGQLSNFLKSEFEKYKYYYDFDFIEEDISIYDYFNGYALRGDDPYIYTEILQCEDLDENIDRSYSNLCNRYGSKLNYRCSYHEESFSNPIGRKLFYGYHFSNRMKSSGRKPLVIDLNNKYMECVSLVQECIRKKVYRLEISIESNPSSNRKISYIDKYINLPMLKFNRSLLDYNSKEVPLSTFINTDDSAIFQTDLSLEYAYVTAALMREGYSIESIYSYIDYLRENSLTQNFID